MKTIYLVDTENVGDKWITMLDKNSDDEFFIFHTDKSPKISYSHLTKLLEMEHKPTFIHTHSGKNALDFQLVSTLGYVIHALPDCRFVILSNDCGFDCVVDFWKDKSKDVSRLITNAILNEHATTPSKEDKVLSKDDTVNAILSCFISSARGVHQTLITLFGTKEGKKIYISLKKAKRHAGKAVGTIEERFDRYTHLIMKSIAPSLELPENFSTALKEAVDQSEDKTEFKQQINNRFESSIKQDIISLMSPLFSTLKEISK